MDPTKGVLLWPSRVGCGGSDGCAAVAAGGGCLGRKPAGHETLRGGHELGRGLQESVATSSRG